MADDGDEAEDERAIELSTLQAIYPEFCIDPIDAFTGTIDIQVELHEPLSVRFPNTTDGSAPLINGLSAVVDGLELKENGSSHGAILVEGEDAKGHIVHKLSHLPPLSLRLSLPDGYPASLPPVVEVQCPWLSRKTVDEIVARGTQLWEDMGRDQVLFAYIDYLREAAGNAFDIHADTISKLAAVQGPLLLDFDLQAKKAKFAEQTYECGICLEPKKGSVSYRLPCSHVFCVKCLQDFYNACITEGDVGGVKCLTPGCGTESKWLQAAGTAEMNDGRQERDMTLEPADLLEIPLDNDIVQRYIKLKQKQRLEADRNTVYCPRKWCQEPARVSKSSRAPVKNASVNDKTSPKNSERPTYDSTTAEDALPPPSERLAICSACSFAFCWICKASWHGEYLTCFPRSKFELSKEEKLTEAYLQLHSTSCPTCSASIQKALGCNHVICRQCGTHFCYLCAAYLMKDNPYAHYNTINSPCYMRLWELEAGDGDDVGQGFAGGAGAVADPLDDEDDIEEFIQVQPLPEAPLAPNIIFRDDPPPRLPPQAAGVQPGAARQPARGQRRPVRGRIGQAGVDPGLERFLQLVQNDEEDEWDSDEMEDGAEGLEER